MKYLFANALKNVWYQKKSYLFFSLQILAAFIIMLVFGSISSSLNRDYDNLKNDNTAKTFYLSMAPDKNSVYAGKNLSFNYDDYQWIKKEYGSLLSVSLIMRYDFITSLDGELKFVFGLFVTDEFFRNSYESDEMKDFSGQRTILVPTLLQSMNDLEGSNEVSMKHFLSGLEGEYKLKDSFDIYNGKNDYVYSSVNNNYEYKDDNISYLKDIMIAPIELYSEELKSNDEQGYTMLTVNFYSETNMKALTEICSHLSDKYTNGSVKCDFTSPIKEFEESANQQITLAAILQTISIVALVITSVGFVGLILVIFNNRRKKLAIALVTGAAYSQLYCEIIAEIETVILTGSILGEIIGILVLNIANSSITYFEFGTDITLAILLPVIYIAIGLIISFAVLYKLVNIQPNEILKKE